MSVLLQSNVADAAPDRQGSGLIVAIWVIGLLGMLVMSFAFDAHLETKILAASRERRQAEHLALSGIEMAQMLLDKQSTVTGSESPDTVTNDRWYPTALQLHIGRSIQVVEPLGHGYVRLEIAPEPGKLNVNNLSDTNWESVLTTGGVPPEMWPQLVDAVDDWMGKNTLAKADYDEYYASQYPPYQARRSKLVTVRELLLVKGFNEAILSGGVLNPDEPPEKQITLRGIQDMLTTFGDDGKVNINAASEAVLMTLPGVDALTAKEIMFQREQPPPGSNTNNMTQAGFTGSADLMSRIPGLDPTLPQFVTFISKIFRITAIGQVGRVTRRIWMIAQWNAAGQPLKILQWREEM